jgi:hypothetical protein
MEENDHAMAIIGLLLAAISGAIMGTMVTWAALVLACSCQGS